MSYLDWYANENKIIDAFTNDENEPYVEVDDMNEVINGQYQAKKNEIKKQQSDNGASKSVTFRSPLTTKDQSPSISSNSAFQSAATARDGQSTNGPIQNRSAAKTGQRPSPPETPSRPSFMEIVKQCKAERIEPKLKPPAAPLTTRRSPGEQTPPIKRPAERSSLTKHSAAINTALHLNFEQFKFQDNNDTFFDHSMLNSGKVNTKRVKNERQAPIEERKIEVEEIRQPSGYQPPRFDQSHQQPFDQSHQQPLNQSSKRASPQRSPSEPTSPQPSLSERPGSFKRSLPDSDFHLPPKKRLLRKWMIQTGQMNGIEVSVRGEPDIVLIDDDFDFIPLDVMNSEPSMREENERTESAMIDESEVHLVQLNEPPAKLPKNHQPSHKITDFFQPRKSTNSSPNLSQARNEQEAAGYPAKEFNYFKPPQIVRIEPDQRLENNSGYRILIDKYSDLFEEFQHFNEVQIGSISLVFETNDSFVLKATTSSGKSTVLEFAIIKLLNELKSAAFKVILVEPVKAIINEKYK